MAPKFSAFTALATLSLLFGSVSAQLTMPQSYYNIRYAHSIMGSIMMIFIFPLGGIVLRSFNFKGVLYVHIFLQMLGYCMFCYVFAAGVYMSFKLDYYIDPHIEIGIMLFGLTTIQPFLGTTHHLSFRKNGKRTFASCLHVLLGRGIITLGMLNGGLGLRLSTSYPIGRIANTPELKAYGIVAGIMWVIYNLVIAFREVRVVQSSDNPDAANRVEGIEARKLGYYEPS